MNIIRAIRELIRKMFPVKTISDAYKMDIAITDSMLRNICFWERMYKGEAPWIDNDSVFSLKLEQAVVREFANITLNEMSAKVSNDRLNEVFQSATKDINKNLQRGLATGAMVIKPLGENKVQYVPQSSFIPIEYDVNGRLIKVIFPEVKQISDSEYFIRLEFHSLDYEKGLTITNRAFKTSSLDTLGKEIPLKAVEEWEDLDEYVTYPLMKRPAFGYYVNPIDNAIDNSHSGVSIYDNAKHLIKLADIQFGRLDWEFEASEKAVFVDDTAVNELGDIDKHKKRLYKGLNISGANGADFFSEYSPQIREANFIAGLEEYKRSIEFAVGLAYGDISNPQFVEKTATEIKAAKKRKYNTVSAIQENLKTCLEDLVYAFAFYNGMATQNYDFICDFKDSILIDDETERTQDRQDVSMGVMPLWEYRKKWYGEDEETAKAMTSDSTAEVVE